MVLISNVITLVMFNIIVIDRQPPRTVTLPQQYTGPQKIKVTNDNDIITIKNGSTMQSAKYQHIDESAVTIGIIFALINIVQY